MQEAHLVATEQTTSVTVIIPARNEEKNIGNVLHDLTLQIYPQQLIEVIIIDDSSEDNTYTIADEYAQKYTFINVLKLQDIVTNEKHTTAYKKKAIAAAVQRAKGKLIITTDADCRLQQYWIQSIVSFYETEKCSLIAAPVGFYNEKTKFQHFQALDFCGMQAITAAMLQMEVFNMANGANLAYEKEVFLSVNGYQDIDHNASGDDMLLVYKVAQKYPEKVKYLKNKTAIVLTEPAQTLTAFLQQRFRWTSKSTAYQDKRMTLILAFVFLFVLSIWINTILFSEALLHTLFFSNHTIIEFISFLPALLYFLMLLFQLSLKSVVDYFFLKSASTFFNRDDLMKTFLSSEILHIWYIPFVGILGNILSYNWKGRTLK